MNDRTKLLYKVIFGIIVIGGTIFLCFRYLLKGSPFVKVLAVGLIVAVIYLVVNFLRKSASN